MNKGDGDDAPDDGIVAEDVTLLVEHIELTGAHRLPDDRDWELATPEDPDDLDEAPILVGSLRAPDAEDADLGEDTQRFVETSADLHQLLADEQRREDRAAALSAERARWQRQLGQLQRGLAERDRRIEELEARIATLDLEREALAAQLRAAAPAAAPVQPAAAPAPAVPAPEADYTLELPAAELPATPAVAAVPRLRRYLIGLDLVGFVHEVVSRRVNIGRTRDNDLRIVDPTVSRLHAMLTVRNGVAMLVDANSRNGIFVNGIQVRYARLDDGDLVTFGTVRFRYRVGSDAAGSRGGTA